MRDVVLILEDILAEVKTLARVHKKADVSKHFYKPSEVAKIMGVLPDTIRHWIKRGRLPAIKLGQGKLDRLRIRKEHVEALLK